MKHNKNNTDTLLFLLLSTESQCEKKKWKKKLFVSAGTQKGWRTVGSGNALPQYLPNFKNTIPVKSIFTLSMSILLTSDKKAKTISLNV